MKTLKVLSALLHYPSRELQAAAGELKVALHGERILPAPALQAVASLVDEIAQRDLYDAQERYILLFDRTRSLSLHLFEHVHGESRDRGQAMVDLIRLYEEAASRRRARSCRTTCRCSSNMRPRASRPRRSS